MSMRDQKELHTIVYIAGVSEEACVVYTFLCRQQLYIHLGQSPVVQIGDFVFVEDIVKITEAKLKLEGNCDFSSNNNVWTTLCTSFGDHFKYYWVIFILRD